MARKGWLPRPPVVAGDAVFVGDQDQDILRLDPPYEAPTWRVPADDFMPSFVHDGLLVLESRLPARALQATTGTTIWNLEDKDRPWVPAGDRVYNVTSGLRVAAVSTGEVVAQYPLPSTAEAVIAVCSDVVILGTGSGSDPIHAFDPSAGTIAWRRNLGREVLAAAEGVNYNNAHFAIYAGAPGSAIVRCARSIFGLSLADGTLRWHRPLWVVSGRPIVHGGRVYLWAKTQDLLDCRLVCLDEATGETVYDQPLARHGEDFRGQEAGPGFIRSDHIAFGARAGVLAVFTLSEGALAWSYRYHGRVGHPALVRGGLLAPTADGQLLVFSTRSRPKGPASQRARV